MYRAAHKAMVRMDRNHLFLSQDFLCEGSSAFLFPLRWFCTDRDPVGQKALQQGDMDSVK